MLVRMWKTVWRFLKKIQIELPYDLKIPLQGIYLEKNKKQKTLIQKMLFTETLFRVASYGSYLSIHQQMNG